MSLCSSSILRNSVLAALLSTPLIFTHLAQASSVDDLQVLVEQGASEQAYTLALELRDEWEGELRYDAWYGMAAMAEGHYHEAQYAFERVLLANPENHRIRLELGRCYYAQGNLEEAERQFQQVRDTQPPAAVLSNIDTFLQRVNQQRDAQSSYFSAQITPAMGSDSNINSSTSQRQVSIFNNLDITLEGEGREVSDEFTQVRGVVNWHLPVSKQLSYSLNAFADNRDNQHSDTFDIATFGAGGSIQFSEAANQYSVSTRYQNTHLERDEFQSVASLLFGWQRLVGSGWQVGANVGASDIRYPDSESRDLYQGMLVLSAAKRWGPHQHSLALLALDEDTRLNDATYNAKQTFGAIYSWTLARQNWQYFTRLSFQSSEYDDEQPLFFTVREDDNYGATVGATWQLKKSWGVSLEASYTRNDSNLSLYDYDRTQAKLSMTYDWN